MNKYKLPLILISVLLIDTAFVMAQITPPPSAVPQNSEPGSSPPSSIISPVSSTHSTSEGPSEAKKTHEPRYSYNSIHVSEPYIAMTFDDGPHPTLTPKLLDLLKEKGIKATFFLIGENVARYPEIVKRMVDEGHEIASHTWSHPALSKCSADKFNHEITAANEAIQAACGLRPTMIRPPYGATTAALDRTMNDKYGLKVILWSVDPMDWRYRNAEKVSASIISHTKPGDIILAHDIHASTIAAMPSVFDALLKKGLKFVTVTQLMAHQTTPPPKSIPSSSSTSPLSEPVGARENPETPALSPSVAPFAPPPAPTSFSPPEP